MRCIKIDIRLNRQNAVRVYGFVAAEIVGSNMVKVYGAGNTRHLIDFFYKVKKVFIFVDMAAVTFEMNVINHIKTNMKTFLTL